MLYSIEDAMFLLGAFANKPSLLTSDKYTISDNEFKVPNCEEAHFHEVLYKTMYNLVLQGATEINTVIITGFLKNYPEQMSLCNDFNYQDFIPKIQELSNPNNIDVYYQSVRKFTMLREYKKAGFSIRMIFDELKNENAEKNKLKQIDIQQIDNYFEGQRLQIKREFVKNDDIEHYKAGSDFMYIKELCKQSPKVGLSFHSEYLNNICRGIQGLTLRSGASGAGKTMLFIADVCKSGIPMYYDFETNTFIKNKSYVGNILFINTEMDLREELDLMFIAWISGVSRGTIAQGSYTVNEEERVDKACEILNESGLYVVDNPEFTCKTIEETIEDYIINKNIKLVCFDYCQNNGYVANELSKQSGIPMREDMVLLTLTDRLKQASRRFNVPILTGTQLNGQEQNLPYPTEACLAGGKAQIRKADNAIVIMEVTSKDESEIEPYQSEFEGKPFPNRISHIIKGRHSAFPKYLKVFQYVDLSNGRSEDYFVTDKTYEIIDVDKLKIENKQFE